MKRQPRGKHYNPVDVPRRHGYWTHERKWVPSRPALAQAIWKTMFWFAVGLTTALVFL